LDPTAADEKVVLRFRRFFGEGYNRNKTMPELGRKYTCYSCHTKFYDLGKPVPLCPKCGADQRDADEAPVYTAPRRGRVAVVEEPVEDDDLAPAAGPAATGEATDDDAEDDFAPADREEEADEEEEEEY
jgi:hypothetical protein